MSNSLKVDEIKKILNDAGVDFDETLKKDELLQLMKDSNLNDDVKGGTEASEETIKTEEPQKKYVVVHDFRDLNDGNTIYIKGDIYPRRADSIVDEDRINELSSTKNKLGKVLIQEQE
ncbi:HeH/LEM domain-containing protein [Bacillus sp. Au-Bac7]|uniref:HeH/LEM domain-containing protein n=1 Tax=Bacillus sp. Au-Bac7 TaxID=2906458 RepID=UPI001E3B0236|nr:HeH/LEM domain-containing protein [Bacillus sp. Au-Bac7]MCE4052026.1 HeH/LEM domain-containing protein [Bacillus sp. Au-Bac7]